jgi:hypothetical protein
LAGPADAPAGSSAGLACAQPISTYVLENRLRDCGRLRADFRGGIFLVSRFSVSYYHAEYRIMLKRRSVRSVGFASAQFRALPLKKNSDPDLAVPPER